ncbi:GNAT family N-acetyltransferase [Actinoplanes sp. NBC_00393]|uniref:GNAT family N-acetyltransferase n=1 Tax=Actinoplanes sp. NBC_00393 TaxID=2975953 RepID=UPI002E1A989D
MAIRLRPVGEEDLAMLRRFKTEPGLIGLDWAGFRDPGTVDRRFAADSYLGEDDGGLIVEVETGPVAAGFVSYRWGQFGAAGRHVEIGIVLLPEWRGQGIGWRAQAMFCEYLFRHTPVHRIQAGTHPENIAEQKALEKAGFQFEGVIRGCEFRDGGWRDGYLYSRLRS